MWKVFCSEWLKLRKSSIWLLIFVSPVLSSLAGLAGPAMKGMNEWEYLLGMMAFIHALLFLPLLTGVFSAFICRYEHISGGWKQLLALPVSRTNVYVIKFLIVMGLIALTQLIFLAGLMTIGHVTGIEGPIPWEIICKSLAGGLVACLPVAALQIFVSVAWSSFAAPLAINVIFTLPNILVSNSTRFGPYYPWTQPFLAMMPHNDKSFGGLNVSLETLMFVILGSFALLFAAGFTYFQKKEI
jgi:lantibiotic transport system permease protein